MPLEVIRLDPQRAENAVNAYGDSLLRLCSVMLGNREDALDAVQETFLKYMTKSPAFNAVSYTHLTLPTILRV